MQRTTKTNNTMTYFIILPLSLVRRLEGELDHPDPGAKLIELDPLKRLGEQIRKLLLGVDVARLEAPFLQAASAEVVPHPDVLAPFMKNGVLCQGQSRLAVHPEFHRSSVSAEEITKQSNKPERLSRSGGGCYVLGLAAGQGHHLLLDRLPAHEALAEEEDPTHALAGVDVAGVVAVTVPDKVCLPRAPWVVEVVVESPCNIADDPLHSLLVLCRRSLHELTNVADGECQVRPCVGEVAKAPHSTSVLRSVHLLRRAIAAQLQPLLHRSESWVAVGEPNQLNDALGVGGLSKRDPGVALVHLDSQVEGERPQVPHLKGGLHLFLKRCHLRILGADDHQVVDVDTHQQGVSSIAPPVDGRLVRALPETHPLERGVQLDISRPRCLPQAIEGLAQAQHLALLIRDRKSRWLMHVVLL
jgi:hypothetical protein